jgi:hypothetical protein
MLQLKKDTDTFTFNTGEHHFVVDQACSQEQLQIVSNHPGFKSLVLKSKSKVVTTQEDDKEASN